MAEREVANANEIRQKLAKDHLEELVNFYARMAITPFSLLHPLWREPPKELQLCRASSRRRALNCRAPRRSPRQAAAISSCLRIGVGRAAAPSGSWSRNIPPTRRRSGPIPAPLDVNGLIAASFIRDRDILVVSQRGTMFSEPALTCALPPLGGWGQIVEADEFRQAGRHIDGEPLHGFSRCRRWPSRHVLIWAILPSLSR
jgi:hypothetical protein